MKPYSVEIFTPDFKFIGSTNVNEISYCEDYLSPDGNMVTVFAVPDASPGGYIRIYRDGEEYAGIITEISRGEDKNLQSIDYKPLSELFDAKILFDTNEQGEGTLESFIAGKIRENFIENEDGLQNIKGLKVSVTSKTYDWNFHITPSEKGGHYNIVSLLDSVIVPALEKYGIVVETRLDVQKKAVNVIIGKASGNVITIESDLPNVLKKNVIIGKSNADINKLILYDAENYENSVTYFLHSDLSYDRKNTDRITPVVCEMRSLQTEEGGSFNSLAIQEAASVFGGLSFSNLIELTVLKNDSLINPESLKFGQEVNIISDGISYRSILTGRETGKTVKLIFGTVRIDLTKILRRDRNV
ncbi:MAG: hypothetical protein NC253_09355 [Ruminococcus sp.]|nr:hypothetical protein [Ruminococcus sp.]MCM1380723.1 hypothetical protein [Muribaculaceae bacterium]MCM1479141.1 hypothetical protein [Muribaculaceae bacterium]